MILIIGFMFLLISVEVLLLNNTSKLEKIMKHLGIEDKKKEKESFKDRIL